MFECRGDGNLLYVWAGAKSVEPPRHPSLKARNKHHKKPAKELCLWFLWLTEPRSEVQAPPPGNRTVSARTHVIESFLCSTSSQKCHKPWCISRTAHKSQIHILLTQIWTLKSSCRDTRTSADPMLSLFPPTAFKQFQFYSKTKHTDRLLLKTDCELEADGIK